MIFLDIKYVTLSTNHYCTSTSMIRASRPFIDSKIRKFASISCNRCLTSWSFLGIEEEEDGAAVRFADKSDRSFIISTM